jgi:hypothetical protein
MIPKTICYSNETFLQNAVVERYNFSKLNKTRIRFKIQLKKTTKSNAPKWADVLKTSQNEQESDLVKVTTSEVGLKDPNSSFWLYFLVFLFNSDSFSHFCS